MDANLAPEVSDSGVVPSSFVPELHTSAFLLDVDGTLVDFAPTPREVWMAPTLRRALERLNACTGGAVAFVSGRPLHELDLIFAPLQLAAVGCHGAEIRTSPGGELQVRAAPLGDSLKRKIAQVAEIAPGVLLEDKGYSLAVHYRLAPEQGTAVRDAVLAICAEASTSQIELLPGQFVVEVKRIGISKGAAVRELMAHPPFAGRRPIFIGDDVTDQSVFDVIPELGGLAFSVGSPAAGTLGCFKRPADVRRWIEHISQADAGGLS